MDWTRRIDDLRRRLRVLASLRKLASLDHASDIGEEQWAAIEGQLAAAKYRLEQKLQRAMGEHLPSIFDLTHARGFQAALGVIEFQLAEACTLLDTYLDVLTQRSSPELGPLLRGCDVLADDALRRRHPALLSLVPPLVYCDRGFGASILREGAPTLDGGVNPVALIQLPYSRIEGEKHNLISILHEAGHQSIIRLKLKAGLAETMRESLRSAGAAQDICNLYALWTAELGPDFWAFCLSGAAQTASIRDILSLSPERVFHWGWEDGHPPPFLRVLISIEWCRQMQSRPLWSEWENEWTALYPIRCRGRDRPLLCQTMRYRREAAQVFFEARWKDQNNQSLREIVGRVAKGSPCAQLSELRALRDQAADTKRIDERLNAWVRNLSPRAVGRAAAAGG